jgi:hypothetical protein
MRLEPPFLVRPIGHHPRFVPERGCDMCRQRRLRDTAGVMRMTGRTRSAFSVPRLPLPPAFPPLRNDSSCDAKPARGGALQGPSVMRLPGAALDYSEPHGGTA